MTLKRYMIFLIIICFVKPVYSQEQNSIIKALYVEEKINIDGNLIESAWNAAVPIIDFTQRELNEGQKATEKTELKMLYDKNNIYIGIICFDSEPNKIIHNELKWDGSIESDDNMAFIIDTYSDFRSGFYFEVNPNGARGDGLITSKDGIDKDWNGVWDVGAAITEYGWSVEIIIPVKTLRFPEKEISAWGFNVRRKIKRKEEEVLWTAWKRNDGLLQLSKAGKLIGIQNLKIRRTIEIKPFSLGGSESIHNENSNSLKYGVDVKYPITSNLVLDLTTHTDFAQVEADQTQINLTRFSIKYPEKREFFLEGGDTFKFGLLDADVFYSRIIGITPDRKQVPILGGARLTRKAGKYRIGFLNMQTEHQNGFPSTDYSVASIRRDILEKSYIGFIATNLYNNSGHDNQAFGTEFQYNTSSFRGNNNLTIGGSIAGTLTDGKGKDNIAGSFSINYPNDQAEHEFSYTVIPEGFNPEIGYVSRKGIQKYNAAMRWSPRPNIPLVKRITFKPFEIKYYTDMSGRLLTRDSEIRPFGIELKSGDNIELNIKNRYEYLDEDFNIFKDVIIPEGIYDWWCYEFQFESNSKRKLALDFSTLWGDYYGTGKSAEFKPDITIKFSENIALSTQFSYNKITVNNQSFSTQEYSERLTLNYSTRLTSRTFIQWNNEDKYLFVNFLVNFIPKIGSNIYFVYNQVWDGEDNYRVYSKTGIAKIAYMFRY